MYVVGKIALNLIQPPELVWLRYLVALVILIVIGLATQQSWQIRERELPLVLAIGII